jgi:SAM-dependent methyltransferase
MFADARFSVIGIESSAAMLELARKAVPHAQFIQGSVYEVELPSCDAVVAVGEIFNYHCEPDRSRELVQGFFQSVHAALGPGGLFVFDIITNGEPLFDAKTWASGEDWAVLVNTTQDSTNHTIVREIDIFRSSSGCYRRTHERHSISVFRSEEVTNWLTKVGFDVELGNGYGAVQLLPRRIAVTARRK